MEYLCVDFLVLNWIVFNGFTRRGQEDMLSFWGCFPGVLER